MSDNSKSNSSVYTGRVKWFNNKAGYGFITVTDSTNSASDEVKSGTDIFVHYSKISLANKQYSYLIQGEYVNFQLEFFETGVHKIQACNVTGINGGKLMCETRREFRLARNSYRESQPNDQPVQNESQQSQSPVDPPKRTTGSSPRAPRAPRAQMESTGRGGGRGGSGSGSGRGQGQMTGRGGVRKSRPVNTTSA